jgi:hypothetical protein
MCGELAFITCVALSSTFYYPSLSESFFEANPMADNNPYLAHWNNGKNGVVAQSSKEVSTSKEPLYGFLPRKVKAPEVQKVLVCV